MAATELDGRSKRAGDDVAVDTTDGRRDDTASGETLYACVHDVTIVESALTDLFVQYTSHDQEVEA